MHYNYSNDKLITYSIIKLRNPSSLQERISHICFGKLKSGSETEKHSVTKIDSQKRKPQRENSGSRIAEQREVFIIKRKTFGFCEDNWKGLYSKPDRNNLSNCYFVIEVFHVLHFLYKCCVVPCRLSHVTIYDVVLCCTVLRHVITYYVMLCCAISRHVVLCFSVSVMSCCVVLCCVMSYHVMFCSVVLCCVCVLLKSDCESLLNIMTM